MSEHRRELLADLAGTVLELGAGNGLNFAHYADTVTEVAAVEPEDYLRERAEDTAAGAPVPIRVVDALADDLPFPDESFDAVVASLVLCSVPDQATALAELRRVLRPAGELRFYEHVRPNNPRTAAILAARRRLEYLPAAFGRLPRRPRHRGGDPRRRVPDRALSALSVQGRPGHRTPHHRPGAEGLITILAVSDADSSAHDEFLAGWRSYG